MPKITLRANWGSHPTVEKVFAYDPTEGISLVLLKYADHQAIREIPDNELEAIQDDPERTFVTVDTVLRRLAEFILE